MPQSAVLVCCKRCTWRQTGLTNFTRPSFYQVYVGNDLFDIRYPTNWHTISPARNIYWFLANHLRVVGYLNYRLRHVKETLTSSQRHALSLSGTAAATEDTAFSVEHYDARSKSMCALSCHC